jgi:hypothetical protein
MDSILLRAGEEFSSVRNYFAAHKPPINTTGDHAFVQMPRPAVGASHRRDLAMRSEIEQAHGENCFLGF